jgi:hypothetical protein
MSLIHFTDAEVAGLIDPVPSMLDFTRGFLGEDIILTFTTGGIHCGHSTHSLGLAADLGLAHLAEGAVRDAYRYRLVRAAMKAGFVRIETAPGHVHLDYGQPPDYVSPILWMGTDS